MDKKGSIGFQLIAIAAFYMMAALVIGLLMGVTKDHSLVSVHSHLGLLGWTTMGLTGLVYVAFPGCGRSALARVHFWFHNLGLPIMMVGLGVLALSGDTRAEPAVALGSSLVMAALLVFTVNLLRNGRRSVAPQLSGTSVGR